MSKHGSLKSPKLFFNETVKIRIQENAGFLSTAGILSKKISLEIEGDEGGEWFFSFDDKGHVLMQHRTAESNSECHIQMSDKTFEGIMNGSVNVPMAFMFRKIKVKGEAGLAVKLGQALQKSFLT